jgi:hypothetical protein
VQDKDIRSDKILLTSFIISVSLNATLVLQILRYRSNTLRCNAAAAAAAAAHHTPASASAAASAQPPASASSDAAPASEKR